MSTEQEFLEMFKEEKKLHVVTFMESKNEYLCHIVFTVALGLISLNSVIVCKKKGEQNYEWFYLCTLNGGILLSEKKQKKWYEFDSDKSGYLCTKELKNFLKSLGIDQSKLDAFAARIVAFYDKNNDGQLALSEMSKLMLSEDGNILKHFVEDENLTKEKFDDIFDHYDLDRNGLIEGSELIAFLRDMRDTQDEDSETKDLEQYKKWIMDQADDNKDGKLSKAELRKLFFG